MIQRDPIRVMETAARRLLPTLVEQGVYLWQGPAIVVSAAVAIAVAAWLCGVPAIAILPLLAFVVVAALAWMLSQ